MFRSPLRRLLVGVAVGTLAVAAPVALTPTRASADTTTDLFVSEYVEGTSNNKALEVFNGTTGAVDLAAGGYAVQVFANGATAPTNTIPLSGTVAAGDVFVLANTNANAAILAAADQRSGSANWNGDDAVVLVKGSTVLDVVGQVGFRPVPEWGTGLTSTLDNTLRRKATVCAGDANGADAFDPAVQWDGYAVDTVDGLGAHTSSCTPGSGGGGGGTDPGPGLTCGASYTHVPAIQGSTETSPLVGTTVETEGVVVGDYEGAQPALRGFYLQDPTGDGDPATSDGIFVFDNGSDLVKNGDVVRVAGTVTEFQGQTQITSTAVATCGTGSVEPTDVTLPMASATEFEKYEGMLVRLPQTLSVTEHFQLGRFGQVVLSSGGRLTQPTSVADPGAAANALQAKNDLNRIVLDDATNGQNPDPIAFGRGTGPLTAENTLRGGDTTTGAVGVMTYTWGGSSASPNAYRVRPLGALGGTAVFEPTNPRPQGPPAVGGTVRAVGMNLLNYFNTFTGCTGGVSGAAMDCRGAENANELERQTAKTVATITKLDADVLGVNEVENDGYGPDSALAYLVGRLNAVAGAGTYAYLDVDGRTGQTDALGSDAIKVGQIYKPAKLTPVGKTAVLNTVEFVNGGDSAPRSRPSLAQAWKVNATGAVFVTDVNHLKSKGSACADPDTGDGQGNCAVVRTNAAKALTAWLASDPTGTGDADLLLLGDYNSYAKETPIRTIEAAGFTNLVAKFHGDEAYSYAFDGQWGYLDHALGSDSLLDQVTGVADYHVNADEPSVLDYNTNFKTPAQQASLYAPDEFRVSDHDPVLVGLTPNAPPTATAAFSADTLRCGRDNGTLTVTITDPDAADTHTVTVDFGDGTAPVTVQATSRTVQVPHTYAKAGRYTATVTVTDSHGQAAPATTVDTVVGYRLTLLSPPAGVTLSLPRGAVVPVLLTAQDCDGRGVSGLAPTVTVTGPTGVVTTAPLTPLGPLYATLLGTRGWAVGTSTVTVTVPSTGQTLSAQVRIRR